MQLYDEYRVQTILTLLQAGGIVVGSLSTGAALKVMGYSDDYYQEIPFLLRFVRNWGFLLLLIPLAWAGASIWLERHWDGFSKRWTLVSGLCLLVSLAWFLAMMVSRAGSTLISVAP